MCLAPTFFVDYGNNRYLYGIKWEISEIMKVVRILLVSVLLILPLMAAAKEPYGPRVGFNVNEVSLGSGFYNDGHQLRPVTTASYLFGRHFSERWFGGISAACAYISFYAGYMYAGERVYDDSFGIRLLLNGRYHFAAKKVSPYVGVDLGSAYVPGYSKSMLPYAGAQLGIRWIINTHNVLGFHVEPAVSTRGYNEVLFKLTYEFI